jgi:hypothetical protein
VGTIAMLAAFTLFILMGIIGGTPEFRSAMLPIVGITFLVGVIAFVYSR